MKRQFQSVINALQEGWFLAGLRVTFANRFAKFLVPHLNRVGIVYFLGHNEGLFSCASLALQDVTLSRPRRINSTFGLVLYKKWIFADPWPRLFSTPDKNELRSLAKPRGENFPTTNWWKCDYRTLPISEVKPFVETYFKPSRFVEDRISFLTEKYSLNPENLLGIHYRGTDKAKEIDPPHLAIVLRDAQEILLTNPGLKVLVQTDDLRAQEYFSSNLGDFSITINELKTSFGSVGAHYRSSARHNAISVVDYLATVQILSKCAYLITHTGHGALWEVLYRGNTENVIQR